MKLSFKFGAIVFSTVCALSPLAHAQDNKNEKMKVLDAVKWAEPLMGTTCDFSLLRGEDDLANSHYFEIKYRDKGQDQDSPDNVYPLYQLLCNRGAYNEDYIYLTRDDDGYQLLSFAQPKLDFDYTDENFAELKAPPKVVGYTATSHLTNADFSPEDSSISMHIKWRGLGDAWSSGTWTFADGAFVLSVYNIDPTYDLNKPNAKQDDPGQSISYEVYPNVILKSN